MHEILHVEQEADAYVCWYKGKRALPRAGKKQEALYKKLYGHRRRITPNHVDYNAIRVFGTNWAYCIPFANELGSSAYRMQPLEISSWHAGALAANLLTEALSAYRKRKKYFISVTRWHMKQQLLVQPVAVHSIVAARASAPTKVSYLSL